MMEELEIIQHRNVSGISIFINTVDYRTSHFHADWELLWVLNEPLVVICGQKSLLVSPGGMVLFSPNQPHEFHKSGKQSTFLCLQISPQAVASAANVHADDIYIRNHLSRADYAWLQQTIFRVARAYFSRTPFFDLYCIGQCSLILHRLLISVPYHVMSAEESMSIARRNTRLLRLIQYVEQNCTHKITLSDFARQEGLSMSYLSHFIKETMNQTFQEYVNSVRFNRACRLMAAGSKSMMEICAEAGFSDYRYFSRSFQRAYGMTPIAYSHQIRHLMEDNSAAHPSLQSEEQIYSALQSLSALRSFMENLGIPEPDEAE